MDPTAFKQEYLNISKKHYLNLLVMLLILTSHLDYFQIHKISETVTVYKKDEKLECRLIYRPISLLPNLRKIFLKPEVKPFPREH